MMNRDRTLHAYKPCAVACFCLSLAACGGSGDTDATPSGESTAAPVVTTVDSINVEPTPSTLPPPTPTALTPNIEAEPVAGTNSNTAPVNDDDEEAIAAVIALLETLAESEAYNNPTPISTPVSTPIPNVIPVQDSLEPEVNSPPQDASIVDVTDPVEPNSTVEPTVDLDPSPPDETQEPAVVVINDNKQQAILAKLQQLRLRSALQNSAETSSQIDSYYSDIAASIQSDAAPSNIAVNFVGLENDAP